MSYRSCLIAIVALLVCPMVARAQVFGGAFGNNALFEPQIDVVNSGAVLDAQATVSADRKYVTMTLRPQNSELLALRTFQFQGAGGQGGIVGNMGGIVGGMNPVIGGNAASVIPQLPNAPMRVSPGTAGVILLKRGITPLVIGN